MNFFISWSNQPIKKNFYSNKIFQICHFFLLFFIFQELIDEIKNLKPDTANKKIQTLFIITKFSIFLIFFILCSDLLSLMKESSSLYFLYFKTIFLYSAKLCFSSSGRLQPYWHFVFFLLQRDFYIAHKHIDAFVFFFLCNITTLFMNLLLKSLFVVLTISS